MYSIVARRVDQQQFAGLHLPVAARGSGGSSRSVRCRRSTDSPRHGAAAAVDAPRSPPSLRIRTRPARAARMPAICASLEISTLLISTLRSYGVLTRRRSVSMRRRVDDLETRRSDRESCAANSSGGVSGSFRPRPGSSASVDARRAGGERVEEPRRLRLRRSSPNGRRSSIAATKASNWLVGSTVSMPVCARRLARRQRAAGPMLLRRIPLLDEQNLAPRRVAGHQHQDRVLLRQTGQVVQVAVLPVFVVDVERVALRRRAPEDQHRVGAETFHHARAARLEIVAECRRVSAAPTRSVSALPTR